MINILSTSFLNADSEATLSFFNILYNYSSTLCVSNYSRLRPINSSIHEYPMPEDTFFKFMNHNFMVLLLQNSIVVNVTWYIILSV